MDINSIDIAGFAGYAFDCHCGRRHSVDIHNISVGKDIYKELPSVLKDFTGSKLFLIADSNTYSIYGQKVYHELKTEGFAIETYVLESQGHLIPDEKAIGRLLVEIGIDVGMLVAVGSGTINDITRILSSKMKIPYVIVGTAPSMDGYASTVSPLIISSMKKTYEAVYPYAILADMNVLSDAPAEMLCAGFGDILGKLTALSDWRLARKLKNEYYCESCVELVEAAIKKCVDNAEGIAARKPEAIAYLMEALILSGVVMGMVGNSRPASGSEHHMAHYWEVDALTKGIEHPLHGNSVGVGTAVIARVYELVKEQYNIDFEVPTRQYVVEQLNKASCHADPKSLGIDKGTFKNSVLHAKEIRPRYTILQLAQDLGLLEKAADILTAEYYE